MFVKQICKIGCGGNWVSNKEKHMAIEIVITFMISNILDASSSIKEG